MEEETRIYRRAVIAIIGAIADLNIKVDRILDHIEGGDGDAEKTPSLPTSEERSLHRAHQQHLDARIRKGEIELAAHGSPLVRLDHGERRTYSIRQIEAEFGA